MSCKWKRLGDEELHRLVLDAVQCCGSMRAASVKVKMNYNTFRRYAQRFGMWKPNPSGKGLTRREKSNATPLLEILEGKHPTFSRGALIKKLLKSKLKENKCEECGLLEWHGKKLVMHLDHINGKSWDHRLENLRMLCPNCHSQTPTYCGRNAKVM